jgi:hypothetical protein
LPLLSATVETDLSACELRCQGREVHSLLFLLPGQWRKSGKFALCIFLLFDIFNIRLVKIKEIYQILVKVEKTI